MHYSSIDVKRTTRWRPYGFKDYTEHSLIAFEVQFAYLSMCNIAELCNLRLELGSQGLDQR